MPLGLCFALLLWLSAAPASAAAPFPPAFAEGTNAYHANDFARAARAFRKAAAETPAAGTFRNLGNAEWHRGQVGPAILAWEQALWIDALDRAARQNLQYARKAAQLEAPDLRWHEVISAWLPAGVWAWITGASLWVAVGVMLLPGILGRPRAPWHQAVAAFALMVFLLCLPALVGIYTRTNLGVVLHDDTPLRLTPTAHAQVHARLTAGTPARLERLRGPFALIRTAQGRGWIEREQVGLISAPH